jgi:hypothetical protein
MNVKNTKETHCSISTATMVLWTCHIMLDVHCLPCLYCGPFLRKQINLTILASYREEFAFYWCTWKLNCVTKFSVCSQHHISLNSIHWVQRQNWHIHKMTDTDSSLCGFLLDPSTLKDEGITSLKNVGKHWPSYTVSHHRRHEYSTALLWNPFCVHFMHSVQRIETEHSSSIWWEIIW